MTYRTATITLSEQSAAEVDTAWRAFEDGRYTETQLVAVVAAIVNRHRGRAVGLADLFVAGLLDDLPIGLAPPDVTARLTAATRSILDVDVHVGTDDHYRATAKRAGRLARAEPLAAGQDAVLTSYTRRDVTGWVRQTDRDPCPLCTTLADGIVRPPSVTFARHPGCACIPVPA